MKGHSRKTSKGIPRYDDAKDTFILSGAEDLVPVEKKEKARCCGSAPWRAMLNRTNADSGDRPRKSNFPRFGISRCFAVMSQIESLLPTLCGSSAESSR
jgi:hypothetical protein